MAAKKKRRLTFAVLLVYFPIAVLYLTFSGELAAATGAPPRASRLGSRRIPRPRPKPSSRCTRRAP